jgi:cellulose synthase/poly-beta-1,6-N-acetylglucosamine synthase-like glycosyltransferase
MLRALLAQADTLSGMEVLVVDNGSTDGTQAIVRQFPVTLLHESRRGISAARNCGLRAARGALIVCLDADTLPTRRWLRELIRPFENPAVVQTAGAIQTFQPETAAERYCDASGIFHPCHHAQAKVFPFAVGMNMAVRTVVAREVGGWDEAFPWGEDIDMSQRLLKAHPEALVYCPRALVFHRNRTTTAALARQANGYGKGTALIYQRYPARAPWGIRQIFIVLSTVSGRGMRAGVMECGRILRLVKPQRAELAACHALWCWCFWRGFFQQYYGPRTSGGGTAHA